MKIKNVTKKTVLSDDAYEATSLKDKTLGLLDPAKPRSLVLHTRFGIHTFGLKKEIDVLTLDTKYKVMVAKPNLKPNRILLWNPRFSNVIELPAGTIRKSQTSIGDRIVIE